MARVLDKLPTALILVLFWLVFKFIDPIGLDAAAKTASAKVLNAITMPFHNFAAAPARDQAAIVLVTDETITHWQTTWPAPYARHARAIETILDAHPKAVMLDYRFATERIGDNLHEFDDAILQARTAGIPLLFSKGRPSFGALPPPLTDLATVTGWDGETPHYPLVIEAKEPGDPPVETAAFDLYARLCGAGTLSGCPHPFDTALFKRPMQVRHGLDVDPKQELALQIEDCPGAKPHERLARAVGLFIRSFSDRFPFEDRERQCPTTLTVNAADLELGALDGSGLRMADLLKDRVVFYGDAITGQNDLVAIPFNGLAPGVLIHAAAFQNLVSYGSSYFKAPSFTRVLGIEVSYEDIAEFVLWLGVVVFIVRHPKHQGGAALPGPHPLPSPRNPLGPWKARSVARTAIVVGVLASLAILDATDRGLGNLDLGGIILGTVLYATAALFVAHVACLVEQYARSFYGGLLVITALSIVLFLVNEVVLRWASTDWLGLVLLFVVAREALEEEESGFVPETLHHTTRLTRWGRKSVLGRARKAWSMRSLHTWLFATALTSLAFSAHAQGTVIGAKAGLTDVPVYSQDERKLGSVPAGEVANKPILSMNPDHTRFQIATRLGAAFVKERDVMTNGAAPPPPGGGCFSVRTAPGQNYSTNGLSSRHCTQ